MYRRHAKPDYAAPKVQMLARASDLIANYRSATP
jgi:hypothetical protein